MVLRADRLLRHTQSRATRRRDCNVHNWPIGTASVLFHVSLCTSLCSLASSPNPQVLTMMSTESHRHRHLVGKSTMVQRMQGVACHNWQRPQRAQRHRACPCKMAWRIRTLRQQSWIRLCQPRPPAPIHLRPSPPSHPSSPRRRCLPRRPPTLPQPQPPWVEPGT